LVNGPPQTYVFDLDGVIYRGDEPQPHASETVRELKRRGRRVFFLTNNSSQSREDYQVKLAGMGISARRDDIMTSAHATALYLLENAEPGERVYVVGEAGLARELDAAGIDVVRDGYSGEVEYVVVGLDRRFNYDKLVRAQQAILAGAKFVATNRDATFPMEGGALMPGGGAIVSAIETASGVRPVLIGKPETYALQKLLELAGSAPGSAVIVGDRLDTDILVGNRLGMHTVLVLTGVSDARAAAAVAPEMKPGRVIADLIDLFDESWIMA
jgi:4-nitrophenyl phosphatase